MVSDVMSASHRRHKWLLIKLVSLSAGISGIETLCFDRDSRCLGAEIETNCRIAGGPFAVAMVSYGGVDY